MRILFLLSFTFAAIPTLVFAQYGNHGHGHSHSYGHRYSFHSPSVSRPPVRYSRPTTPAPRPAQPRVQASRPASVAVQTPRPSASSTSSARTEPQLRIEQARSEAMEALEQIAREARERSRQGFDCVVNQSGGMNCFQQPDMSAPVSFENQLIIRAPHSYSGTGEGRSNPAYQNVPHTGPIPQGIWQATGSANRLNGSQHPNVIHLAPAPSTETFNRTNFRMHGDNPQNDASEGCVIAPPATRQALADMLHSGGQVRLEVKP